MIHSFIHNGVRYALDTVSGKAFRLSELEFNMLGYLKPPLSPSCPVSLRYSLAKFTLSDVNRAYENILGMFGGSFGASPSPCESCCPDECAGCWARPLCRRFSDLRLPDDAGCSEEKTRIEGEASASADV